MLEGNKQGISKTDIAELKPPKNAAGETVCSRSGNTWTMQGDWYPYTLNLDDASGAMRLVTNGFRLFVYDTLTIDGQSIISHNGGEGEPGESSDAGASNFGEGGSGAAEGTLAGGATGGAGHGAKQLRAIDEEYRGGIAPRT